MIQKLRNYYLLSLVLYVKLIARLSLSLAGRGVGVFWFKVQRIHPHLDRHKWIAESEKVSVPHRGKTKNAYRRRPQNPTQGQVILLHGWSGRWDQLLAIGEALYLKNFEVITFDQPGHGENPEAESDFPEQSEFLKQVCEAMDLTNPIVICHSAGFLALSHAVLVRQLQLSKLVSINSPARFEFLFELFREQLKLPKEFDAELWKVIERRLNAQNVRAQFRTGHMSSIDSKNVLNIHDETDKEVKFTEFSYMNKLWPEAKKLTTTRLGHNRILKDKPTIESIIDFLN